MTLHSLFETHLKVKDLKQSKLFKRNSSGTDLVASDVTKYLASFHQM